MKLISTLLLSLLLSCVATCQTYLDKPAADVVPHAFAGYGSLPLSFEPNLGQTSKGVQWIAHGPEYALFLSGSDAVLELNLPAPAKPRVRNSTVSSAAIRMNLLGAQPGRTGGEQPLAGTANYFTGNHPENWQSNVPTFARVRLSAVYPGVDLVYYGRQGRLEYDFIVAPEADASRIALQFDGANPRLAENGDLVLPVSGTDRELRFDRPTVYQMKDGVRSPVAGEFQILAGGTVRFKLGSYDRHRELVIDPTLLFAGNIATGNQQTIPQGMTIDASGAMYLTGYTNDLTFPVTTGALQTNCQTYSPDAAANGFVRCGPSSSTSGFVTKISPDGTSLVYSTYLHGGGGAESGQSIAVDSLGDAYVLGDTSSNDFPVTANAYQTLCQPTYSQGAYFAPVLPITSQCDNFHNGGGTEYTVNGPSLFIAKLNPQGSALLYSTFFGGSAAVYPAGIALDSAGNIFFASEVNQANSPTNLYPYNGLVPFPTTTSGYQTIGNNLQTPALSELSADGQTLLYSTFLGSLGSNGHDSFDQALALGQNGVAFIGGFTSTADFPTTVGSIKPACPLNTSNTSYCFTTQGFAAAIDTTKVGPASLVYSTYLGGDQAQTSNIPEQEVYGLAADAANNLFVTGYTSANDYPSTAGVFQPHCNDVNPTGSCNQTAFLSKINTAGTAFTWSTLFGGTRDQSPGGYGAAIAFDPQGQVYLYGQSNDGSGDFPGVNPISTYSSGNKVFLATFSPDATKLLFATRFSGANSAGISVAPIGKGLAVDPAGNMYIVGYSGDGGSFGATPGTYSTMATSGFNRPFFAKILPLTAQSSTTFTYSPAMPAVSQNITFSAKVTGDGSVAAIPSGTVTLLNLAVTPTATLGTIRLDATGAGTFMTSALPQGTYQVKAVYSGDTNFEGSTSTAQTLVVSQAQQTIAFGALSPMTYGTAPIALNATASSGLPITYTVTGPAALNGSTLTITGAGQVIVTASQPGNATYAPAPPVSQTLTVDRAILTVTANSLSRNFGAANPAFTYSTTGFVNGDTASVIGGAATLITTATSTSAVGTYPITFSSQALTATNYTFNYVSGVLTVLGNVAQTITFPAIPNHTVGDAPFALSASASSGLAVSYAVTSGPATVAGNLVTLTGTAGPVTITATQAGNSAYAAATPVTQSFTVSPSQVLTLTSITPSSGAIGSPATTITLTGTNFSTSDSVQLNGVAIASTYVSPVTLNAIIPASFFAAAGTGQVLVRDTQKNVTSAAVPFIVSTAPQIVFTGPSSANSAQQPTLNFQLVNPYPVPLAGTLTLTFAPSTSAGTDDPAVQFSSGGRAIAFTIPANSIVTPAVRLQTGTVAGVATVQLAVTANGVIVTPASVAPVLITIPPAVPTLTSSTATRSGNTLTVFVVGFSNTREAANAVFHFTPIAGGTIDNPDQTLSVGPIFTAWYITPPSATYGSAFTYTQIFTLDQDAAVVQNVIVTLSNTVGSSAPTTAP